MVVSARMKGVVVFFNERLGYGFVKHSETGVEYFCHHTQIEMEGFRSLEKGQIVEFEVGKHRDKLQANRVIVLQEVLSGAE